MTLFDQIERDSYELSHREAQKTGKFPKTACYLGMIQRQELMEEFSQQPHMVPRKFGEPWPEDPQIAGCKIFYVIKADHYNVTLLNS